MISSALFRHSSCGTEYNNNNSNNNNNNNVIIIIKNKNNLKDINDFWKRKRNRNKNHTFRLFSFPCQPMIQFLF